MRISASITGLEKIVSQLQGFSKEALAGQVRAVQDSTLLIHETAVKLIQSNTDGTQVKRYNPKRIAVASHPGDPPNTDTGRLVQSIQFDFQDGGLTGRVGTGLRYGLFLEFGTQRMRPRPWLSTAVQMASKEVAEIFAKRISEVIKGVD